MVKLNRVNLPRWCGNLKWLYRIATENGKTTKGQICKGGGGSLVLT